jgi:hypothetical protein
MKGWAAERWAAVAGIGFVVLNLIGAFAPGGSYPKVNDSPAKIAAFAHDHHQALALAALLTGLATPLLIWLFAGIASVIRNAGHGPLAVVLFGVAVAGTTLAAASDAVWQVLGRVDNDDFIKAAFQTQGFLVTKAFWCAAIGALVVGLAAQRGAFVQWYAWVNFAAAVLFVLGGLTVRDSGLLQSAGGLTFVAFLGLLVWVLVSSFVLWTMPASEDRATPATAPV